MTVPVGAEEASDPRPGPVHDVPLGPGPRPPSTTSARDAVSGLCPYLTSSGGSWRLATVSRDHRCAAVDPPTAQSSEKQRRHCLTPDHVDCPMFRAARDARAAALAGGADRALVEAADRRRRPLARTAPILLEPPRLLDQAVRLQFDRGPGQLALIGLMVLAFAIVALTRFSAGAPPAPSASSAPSSSAAVPSATPRPTPTATPSSEPSSSGAPSGSLSPSFSTTYRVEKGDTLLAIASRYGTTAARIRSLNSLTSSKLKIGQVLKIP